MGNNKRKNDNKDSEASGSDTQDKLLGPTQFPQIKRLFNAVGKFRSEVMKQAIYFRKDPSRHTKLRDLHDVAVRSINTLNLIRESVEGSANQQNRTTTASVSIGDQSNATVKATQPPVLERPTKQPKQSSTDNSQGQSSSDFTPSDSGGSSRMNEHKQRKSPQLSIDTLCNAVGQFVSVVDSIDIPLQKLLDTIESAIRYLNLCCDELKSDLELYKHVEPTSNKQVQTSDNNVSRNQSNVGISATQSQPSTLNPGSLHSDSNDTTASSSIEHTAISSVQSDHQSRNTTAAGIAHGSTTHPALDYSTSNSMGTQSQALHLQSIGTQPTFLPPINTIQSFNPISQSNTFQQSSTSDGGYTQYSDQLTDLGNLDILSTDRRIECDDQNSSGEQFY